MRPRTDLLWPRPRHVELNGDVLVARDPLRLVASAAAETAEVRRAAELAARRSERGHGGPHLLLAEAGIRENETVLHLRSDPTRTDEAYALRLDSTGGELLSSSPVGLFRGLTTLDQWLALHRDEPGIPGIDLEDAPDLPRRGLLLDVSRDRVPTMDTLYALVERMADWKLNQLQLYTEHTFAYAGHEGVWQDASPLTGEEVEALDAFCRERFIELVPNQQSFGHMHRWLVHERYRPLAEVPAGIEHPFSDRREPFGLCPTDPRSLELLADLYAQLLPHFSSRVFNVGLDETIDLGLGRSAKACAERGRRAVYLEFLRAVHGLAARHGRRIQLWADVLLAEDGDTTGVPDDAIPLVWGYEADHPFDRELARLAASGRDFYACPGTSSWMSLTGRLANALGNLASAARAARATGAAGMLIADWGDHGHLQPPAVSLPPLLAGAGFAWRVDSAGLSSRRLAALVDLHAHLGLPGGGRALCALGDAYRATGVELRNGSVLFHLLVFPHRDLDEPRFARLTPQGLERAEAAIDSALRAADRPLNAAGARLAAEIEWVGELLKLACRLGTARLAAGRSTRVQDLSTSARRELLDRYAPLVDAHGRLWLQRSRPGGMADSARRLHRLLDRLRA